MYYLFQKNMVVFSFTEKHVICFKFFFYILLKNILTIKKHLFINKAIKYTNIRIYMVIS